MVLHGCPEIEATKLPTVDRIRYGCLHLCLGALRFGENVIVDEFVHAALQVGKDVILELCHSHDSLQEIDRRDIPQQHKSMPRFTHPLQYDNQQHGRQFIGRALSSQWSSPHKTL